ncbi:MAG: RICIN domain-containing protein, partial [Ethanoligenens sp.]
NYSAAVGGQVHQYTYADTANQKWVFEDTSTPTLSTAPSTSVTSGQKYYLRSDKSGLFLSAQNGGTISGTTVDQENFTGGPSQMRTIIDIGGGYYNLICNNSNLALDIPNGSDSNSLTMQIYSQNGLSPGNINYPITGTGHLRC